MAWYTPNHTSIASSTVIPGTSPAVGIGRSRNNDATMQKEAMADALSEANMVAEEGANGDASSKDKGRPRTDREGIRSENQEGIGGSHFWENFRKIFRQIGIHIFSIPYKTRLDTNTFLGCQSPPAVATRSKRRTERMCRAMTLGMTTLPMPSTMVLGLSAPFVVPNLFARFSLS